MTTATIDNMMGASNIWTNPMNSNVTVLEMMTDSAITFYDISNISDVMVIKTISVTDLFDAATTGSLAAYGV